MADLPPPYSEEDPAVSSNGDRAQSGRHLPSGASSSLSQDSTFGVLKDAGKAQEQLDRALEASEKAKGQTSQGYIDNSGNLKRISPAHNVNPNQFYASVDPPSPEQLEKMTSDNWGPGPGPGPGLGPRQSTISSIRLGIIEEASPTAETGQVSKD